MQVAVVFTAWLIVWMGVGTLVGGVFGMPWSGTANGFVFGILATFSWPWIMPRFIDDWMDDNYAPSW